MWQKLKGLPTGTPKERYVFWSVVVFLISLFSFCTPISCWASPTLHTIVETNITAHFFFYFLYFVPAGLYRWINNRLAIKLSSKVPLFFLWVIGIFGLLTFGLTIYGSIVQEVYHYLKDISISIAIIVTCIESRKKMKSLAKDYIK
jgi:hypothetical protein